MCSVINKKDIHPHSRSEIRIVLAKYEMEKRQNKNPNIAQRFNIALRSTLTLI